MKTKAQIAILVFVAVNSTAYASSFFRCPNGSVISAGDRISVVAVKCDSPSFVNHRTESEETSRGRIEYIDVQEWTYNQGQNKMLTTLIFRDGVLHRIETGGYGR